MNLYITFIVCFTFCPFAMAIFGFNIPPFYFGGSYTVRNRQHQHQHNRHHEHHQSQSQTHHSSSSIIQVGSSNTKNQKVVGHENAQQVSKSKESKFFIKWVYKYAASVNIGSRGSIGIGIGIGHGHSVNGGNQINSGSNHGGEDKQKPHSGLNENSDDENQNNPLTNDDSSYVTEQSVQRPVTHITTTTEPTKETTTAWELDEDEDCETVSPIPEINLESITVAPDNPLVSITTEKSIVTPKFTTSIPAQSGSNQSGKQAGQSSEESEANSHSGSSENNDIYGVNYIIESIASQLEQTQAQSLPCPPEQLIIIRTGPVKVEKNTDASTGSTSIIVKPVIVVAPISVASSCGQNCKSL